MELVRGTRLYPRKITPADRNKELSAEVIAEYLLADQKDTESWKSREFCRSPDFEWYGYQQ